jgi:hypothetical protein
LLSQALGGLTASVFHHKFGNVNLAPKTLNPKTIAKKLSELGYIWGIFDQGPCREIRWKSFVSPASPIAEQNGDCHKCLNGRMLQPDSQTNPEVWKKSPKFE